MIDKNKIKRVFELYEYICLEEKEDYIVYAVGRNLYPGVEIVCFDDVDDAKIESLVSSFRLQNYSVRVCKKEQVSNIEDYLFDWFFQVEQSNKKIKNRYAESIVR